MRPALSCRTRRRRQLTHRRRDGWYLRLRRRTARYQAQATRPSAAEPIVDDPSDS